MTSALRAEPSRGGWGLQLLLYLTWASTWPIGKWALQYWTPLGLIAARHALAGAVLLLLTASSSGARLPIREVLAVGLLQYFAYYFLSYIALGKLDSGTVALVSGCYPVFVALIAGRVAPRSSPDARAWSALLAVIAGSLLIARAAGARSAAGAAATPMGLHLAALLSAFSLAIATTISARVLPPAAGVAEVSRFVGAAMLVASAVACLGILLVGEPFFLKGPEWPAALTLAYLSLFGSVGVFLIHTALLRKQAAWKVAAGYPLVPALSLLLGALLLGERPGVETLPGIILLFAGLVSLAFAVSRERAPQR